MSWVQTTEPLVHAQRDHLKVRTFRLEVVTGADRGLVFTSVAERAVIGTHDGVDLKLTDRAVSRFHVELEIAASGVLLTDLGSRNGTAVDGVPVLRAPLRDGATIALGASTIAFSIANEHAVIPLAAPGRFELVVGASPAMRAVMAQLARIASTDATTLLEGETGTGKELAAESIHRASARRESPFLVVDCGAIPDELIEAELFGHVAGAFTGAETDRAGVFEAAAGGTVFLDEIGELELALQPKLLRVLEKREIKRVGESTYRPIDVRIVAATHRDLRAEVNAQRFRPDLYFRLAIAHVRLPPLRERADDLPLLVDAILERLDMSTNPLVETLRTHAFRERLAAHAWPGNVRELRNYLERCLVLRSPMPPGSSSVVSDPVAIGSGEPFKEARDRWLRVFEHAYLADLLAKHDGNVSAAARTAGIDRIHLYRLLWRSGLKKKDE